MRCGGDRRNKLLVIADFPMRFRVKNLIRLVIKKNLVCLLKWAGFYPFWGGNCSSTGLRSFSFLFVSRPVRAKCRVPRTFTTASNDNIFISYQIILLGGKDRTRHVTNAA